MRKRIGKGAIVGIAAGALALSTGAALGAEGDLDTTFSTDGKLTLDAGDGGVADGVAVDDQSRVLVAGRLNPAGPVDDGDFAVARFFANGSPDTSFSGDGLATLDGTGDGTPNETDDANAVAVDKTGRILVAGSDGGADTNMMVARFSSAGNLDTTYGGGDGIATLDPSAALADVINDIALDGNNKVVAGGDSNNDFAVALLTVDGAPDPSYGGGDGFDVQNIGAAASDDTGSGVAIDSAGRVVLAGRSGPLNMEDFAVARWTSVGVLDTSFSTDGKLVEPLASQVAPDESDGAFDVAIGASDKVILAGFAEIAGQSDQAAFLSLTSTGAIDNTFSADGKAFSGSSGTTDRALGASIDGQGKLVWAGETDPDPDLDGNAQFLVGRLLATGDPDNKFSGDGVATTDITTGDDQAEALALDPKTRRIVVAGANGPFATADFAVARYEGVPRCKGKVPTLAGTQKDDNNLNGTKGADVVWGGAGKDSMKLFGGKDTACGDDGNDIVKGGKGGDTVLGGKGADRLSGNQGKDVLSGNKGKDTLLGGPGKDKLKGGPGKDIVKQGKAKKKKPAAKKPAA